MILWVTIVVFAVACLGVFVFGRDSLLWCSDLEFWGFFGSLLVAIASGCVLVFVAMSAVLGCG